MRIHVCVAVTAMALIYAVGISSAIASDYPTPQDGIWTVRNFTFDSGEVLPELRLHYTTVGRPDGEPVVLLHGTNGSAISLLTDTFAGELFGAGQPLDAARYFIIIPDAVGSGRSSKPSDGLRAKFPHYNYEDMNRATHSLLKDGLGISHLRLLIGSSMGGMQAWLWGATYPEFTDAIVPLAALPSAMSGRNWIMRRMVIDAIRSDPAWNGGQYESQPQQWKTTYLYYSMATSGGTRTIYSAAPTREKTDAYIDQRLTQSIDMDANDVLYQLDGARDYDPAPGLNKFRCRVLAIVSEDDERNPKELGVLERETQRIPQAQAIWIPIGPESRGHATTANARLWKAYLMNFMSGLPPFQKR